MIAASEQDESKIFLFDENVFIISSNPAIPSLIKEKYFLLLSLSHNNSSSINKSNNIWSLGSYNEFAIFILPVSAHLVKLCNISSGDHVLDVEHVVPATLL